MLSLEMAYYECNCQADTEDVNDQLDEEGCG